LLAVALHYLITLAAREEALASARIDKRALGPCVPGFFFFFKYVKWLTAPRAANSCRWKASNDRLSSSSKGRVRENFLINQQMSTFTSEIRIESAESARVPIGEVDSADRRGQIHRFFIIIEGLNWENPNFSPMMYETRE
jgi:hypothetical protein